MPMKKNKDHEWGESPEDCLTLVIACIIVIALFCQCTGAWNKPVIEEYIEESEVTTTYESVDTCGNSLPN